MRKWLTKVAAAIWQHRHSGPHGRDPDNDGGEGAADEADEAAPNTGDSGGAAAQAAAAAPNHAA